MKAAAQYSVKSWEEKSYVDLPEGRKATKATVQYEFKGDLEGVGKVEYLMFYTHVNPANQHLSTASYVGLIQYDGKVGGMNGSFAMKDSGAFESGTANSRLEIISGSGSGALAKIRGIGFYQANASGFHLELDYEL